jgi:RNA polymerase sigma-70 factor, ECF subfamily
MSGPIDRHTVDRLVVEHLPAALRLAQRLSGDLNTAEEVVQEALCRLLRRWTSYRGEAAFSTWMMQIVVNVERDRRRRRRDLQQLSSEDFISGQAGPKEEAEATELGETIRAAIELLPDRQREVAMLCLGEGLDARATAEILGTTETNVHACLYLARKRIAAAIGNDYVRK